MWERKTRQSRLGWLLCLDSLTFFFPLLLYGEVGKLQQHFPEFIAACVWMWNRVYSSMHWYGILEADPNTIFLLSFDYFGCWQARSWKGDIWGQEHFQYQMSSWIWLSNLIPGCVFLNSELQNQLQVACSINYWESLLNFSRPNSEPTSLVLHTIFKDLIPCVKSSRKRK